MTHAQSRGVSRVLSGINADPIVNAGHSWHWSGTGLMGQDGAHVSVFGHRTEYGGPYRYVHTLQAGDLAVVRTQDGREFTYRYVRRDIVLGAERKAKQAIRDSRQRLADRQRQAVSEERHRRANELRLPAHPRRDAGQANH